VIDFSGTEVVGYVPSALVVLSLTMASVVRLRLISLVGSVVFVVYGGLIDSVPLIVTNIAIAGINVWFLWAELGGRSDLGVVRVPHDSPFLLDFLHHHLADIRDFQPDFDGDTHESDLCLVLTRDGLPAGVVTGRVDGDDLCLELDYVLRAYRDSRLGQWLYGEGATVL
jgi:hypothetical protein